MNRHAIVYGRSINYKSGMYPLTQRQSTCNQRRALKLWLDTDAGVDDALALGTVFAAAAAKPERIHIEGISVVRGNVVSPRARRASFR